MKQSEEDILILFTVKGYNILMKNPFTLKLSKNDETRMKMLLPIDWMGPSFADFGKKELKSTAARPIVFHFAGSPKRN